MSNDIYNSNSVRVPVRLVNGQWEFFYGGGLSVKNGTVGDLLIDKSSIQDKKFLATLKRKSKHKILENGTDLLVALTIKPEPALDENLKAHLVHRNESTINLGDPFYFTLRSPDTRFVKVFIGGPSDAQKLRDPKSEGGVWLQLEGLQPKGILTSTVKLPDVVSKQNADSLNHAFTMLSEKYEPWRKSHTGNIYDRVLYQEKNQKWYPLNMLRRGEIAKEEHQLIHDRWLEITKELNLQLNSTQ